jgi:glycosyltransferase involved in cell wall biosynthesis
MRSQELLMDAEIRVLHVNNTDVAGGRFNGFKLCSQLPAVGVASQLAVWEKKSTESYVWPIAKRRRYFLLHGLLTRIESFFSIQAIFHYSCWSLLFDLRSKWANVIHLHLIQNHFFSLLLLPFLTRFRPTVWTIHDAWAMTGRCVQPFDCEEWKSGCGACPDLQTPFAMRRDRSGFMWRLKRFVYRNSKLELIVASEKLRQMVGDSPLLGHFKTHVVPFGLDPEVFHPTDKHAARKRLGVAEGALVISFRINSGAFKGGKHLVDALKLLKVDRPICLISMDERGMLDCFRGKFQIVELGWVNDESVLVDFYNAADLFIMPSLAEAFGVMAIESMACGVPVVVFDGTALPGVVGAPNIGVAVPSRSSPLLAEAIGRLLQDPVERNARAEEGLKMVRSEYLIAKHLESLRKIYQALI